MNTLTRTLTRLLNRHPYSDTLNRPASADPGGWSVRGIIKGQIHPQILRKIRKDTRKKLVYLRKRLYRGDLLRKGQKGSS